MSTYEPDTDVILDFALDIAGEPDNVQVVVEDEEGYLMASTQISGVLVDVTGNVARVTVQAAANALPAGHSRGHRIVMLSYSADEEFAGTRQVEQDYALETGLPLTLQVNSFQTYNQALALAAEIHDLASFTGASREARIRALKDAWRGLVTLNYSFDPTDDQTRIVDAPGRVPWDLSEISAEEFDGLDPRLQLGLKRAQIIEANELIAGGGAAKRRLDGILSSTIGETSQMFRIGKPREHAVSPRALKELRGFTSFALRIRRA